MKKDGAAHRRLLMYALRPPEQLFQDLGLSESGLSPVQAEASRRKYGRNETGFQKKEIRFYQFRRAFLNPFSLVLLLLAGISFFTDVVLASNFSRNGRTVAIILSMLVVSGLIRLGQEFHAKKVTDRLTRLVHLTVTVRRDGVWQALPSEALVVGDRVRLSAGDRVPADMRLIRSADCFVSQSMITGESGLLEKEAVTLPAAPRSLSDYSNTLFLGSTVMGGSCEGIVLAVGKDTVYGGFSPSRLGRKRSFDAGENSIAWVLIRFMAALTPVVFLACGLTRGDWLSALLFSLSVAVGLTPELLPMVMTACLARGSLLMSRKQTVVKSINAMQGFGGMDVLCVDKTGTLTGDTVRLEYYMDVLGNESEDVLRYAYLNSVFHSGAGNPLDEAVRAAERMPGREGEFAALREEYEKLDEIPFGYSRRMASLLLRRGDQRLLVVKGNADDVLRRCRFAAFRGEKQEIGESGYRDVHAVVDDMMEDGMKVLAVAVREMDRSRLCGDDEEGLTLLGYLAFFDPPRQSAASAVRKLETLQVQVKVLTGDHREVAASVCRRLGIGSGAVLTGLALDDMTEDERLVAVESGRVFAELSPRQKAEIVEILQDNGHTVGFLGDGMNDLPAVMQADVGISVDTAAEAVKESADVILLRKDLNVLEEGVLTGRKAFANMSKYVKITASSNFGNICAIVAASLFLPFFPMTAVQLLLLNLLYDILCLALPWDTVDEELYRKPLEWSGRTLGRFMLAFGPLSSVFDLLTFVFLYFFLGPALCGGDFSSLSGAEEARFIALFQTGWFLESMWSQVLILHLLRTRRIPFFQSRPSRPLFCVTVAGILLFTVLAVTPFGTLLGMTAMPPAYFLFLAVVVAAYLLTVTLAKRWVFKKYTFL